MVKIYSLSNSVYEIITYIWLPLKYYFFQNVSPAEARILVLDNVLLVPGYDVYILVNTSVTYSVNRMHRGKTTGLRNFILYNLPNFFYKVDIHIERWSIIKIIKQVFLACLFQVYPTAIYLNTSAWLLLRYLFWLCILRVIDQNYLEQLVNECNCCCLHFSMQLYQCHHHNLNLNWAIPQ